MATMLADEYSLVPEETHALEEEQILLSAPTNGKRKISSAFLSPPYSTGSVSSSNSSTSVRMISGLSQDSFELPEQLTSVTTLEMIGFNKKVAGDIFARWATRPDPDQNTDDILDYAFGDLARLKIQPLRDATPVIAMAHLGISDELQQALMDPRFAPLFHSETLHHWLRDTMIIRYRAIEKLLERLKAYAGRTLAKRKERKRPKLAGTFDTEASSSSPPSLAAATAKVFTDREQNAFRFLPPNCTFVETSPAILDNHYVLYKGMSVHKLEGDIFISADGSVKMSSIRTYAGGDFNSQHYAYYWTPEESTAEQYRKWAVRRCSFTESWIIRIQVPKAWFNDNVRISELWFSADWKEYVWNCRKGTTFMPEKFDKYWKTADMVKGHICGRGQKMARIIEEHVQTNITESDCLYLDGRKATQWAFQNPDVAVKALATEIRGKVYIEVHAATNPPATLLEDPMGVLSLS